MACRDLSTAECGAPVFSASDRDFTVDGLCKTLPLASQLLLQLFMSKFFVICSGPRERLCAHLS